MNERDPNEVTPPPVEEPPPEEMGETTPEDGEDGQEGETESL